MKNLIRIILSLVAILGVAIFISKYSNEEKVESDGSITFILIDENGQESIKANIDFFIGDTLFDVLNREFAIVCADEFYERDETCSHESIYGKAVLEIESVITDWNNNFLGLYKNDEYASYGVSKLSFTSGDIITFKWTPLS